MIGRSIRRLVLLGLLAAAGAVLYTRVRGHQPAATPSPSWPPFEPAPASSSAAAAARVDTPSAVQPLVAAVTDDTPARWVAPVDGQCPEGYPIKANDNSGIFHVPGGRFYARTVPERCYAAAEDAVADGYRQAKA